MSIFFLLALFHKYFINTTETKTCKNSPLSNLSQTHLPQNNDHKKM